MKLDEKCLRWSGVIAAIAIGIRLLSGGIGEQIWTALSSPNTAAALLFLETGRRFYVPPETTAAPLETTQAEMMAPLPTMPEEETHETTATEPAVPAFAPEDASLVEVNSLCRYDVDISAMLSAPLTWNLMGDEPTVLILHSHATESYTKTEDYEESSAYRTLSTDHNMVSVGREIAALLEEKGIGVIHDTTLYDYPSYNSSYVNAREGMAELLEEYPTVKLVLDLHRDGADSSAEQPRYTVDTAVGTAAQVMMVVGTNASGRNHPEWEKNMALAVKLHTRLEQNTPGICRPISLRSDRFNQDLSPGAMIIEVGAAGNTRQEALAAARLVAQGILDLANGCVTEDFAS